MPTRHVLAFLSVAILTSCASSRFTPARPDAPNRTDSCVGTIQRIVRTPEDGVALVIHLEPIAEDAGLLAPGQVELPCAILAAHADRFAKVRQKLAVKQRLEIHGYLVRDRNRGDRHALRPITSIDPYPER